MPNKKTVTVEPVTLTPEQENRLLRALAVFDAKRAALRAGMSLAEVQAQTWIVHVNPIQASTV